MAKEDELKKTVKESVKNVVKETVGDFTSQIAKASTKKIIKKLTGKLKEKALHTLEHCSQEISEHGLDGQLDKSAEQVAGQLNKSIEQASEKIAKDSFERVDFVKRIEKGFEKGFKKCLSSVLKPALITCITVAVIGGGAWAAWPSPPPPPPPPQPVLQPDLVITEVWHRGTDKGVIIYYQIKNQGNAVAGETTTSLYLGDRLLTGNPVSPLAPGETREGSFPPYMFSNSGFEIELCADGGNIIRESNEDNNRLSYKYEVPLDMTPPEVKIGHSPEKPGAKQRVTFTVEARDNVAIERIELLVNGAVVLTGSSSPCIYVGGPYEAGSSVSYGANAFDKAGNRTWTGYQTFNIPTNIITPPPLIINPDVWKILQPDLVITGIWAVWTQEGYVIHYQISNKGNIEAGASTTYLFSIYRPISDDVGPLPAGQTREETFPPYKFSDAGFEIELLADGNYLVSESDEDNNRMPYSFKDVISPEVKIDHSISATQVTFTVEAWDDVAIDRIELQVNGEIVKIIHNSTCVYVGGPYKEGEFIHYSANVYDKAGNRTWTGYKTFNMGPY